MTKTFLLIPAAIWLAGCGGAPPEKRAASAAPAMAVSTVTAATEQGLIWTRYLPGA